ncbi:MAG: GNAT family protein [Eubacteriales bacterium]|nr:GNAT family protein [Eubacteriales bacterium]
MYIRKAKEADMETILSIYARARDFQKSTGNPNQWKDGYPQRELLLEDLVQGCLYVCIQETQGVHEIAAVFAYFTGEDATYRVIRNGAWLNDDPYGTVHRIAASGIAKGTAAFCFDWAFAQCPNIRIDTHRDNVVMQNVLKKNGFIYCGEITTHDGTPRMAYQKSDIKDATGS